MNQKRKTFLFTLYANAFMIAISISGTMFSTILPKLINDYGLSLSQAGLFLVFVNIGNLAAMFFTGLIGDRLRKSMFMGIIFILIGVLLGMISLLPPFVILLILMTLLGSATSMLNLVVTAYISDLYGERRTKYINLLHVYYGVGSLVGPSYPMILGRAGLHWQFSYLILCLIVLFVGSTYLYLYFVIKEPQTTISIIHNGKNASSKISIKQMFHYRGMLALCIMSFLYMGGHQGAFSTWFQTYLQAENVMLYSGEFTSLCMTIYWIGMVISRLISSSASSRISARQFIMVGSVVGVIALFIGMMISVPIIWLCVVFVLGLSTGAIYPLTFVISCEWFPTNSARVASFVGVFSALGGMFFGWLVGQIAELGYFNIAMYIPVVSLITVFMITWKGFRIVNLE